jgi:hypothetical protein
MMGYKVSEAESTAHLENLLNLLVGRGWIVDNIIDRGGCFVVVSSQSMRDRHEFRPRDWRPNSESSDALICARCHYLQHAPWHINVEEPPPHSFKLVDENDPDYIACVVCGKFPEHPTHKGGELARVSERDQTLEDLAAVPHMYIALGPHGGAPCAVCEGLEADSRHVRGQSEKGSD